MSAGMHPVTAGQHDDEIVAMRLVGKSNKEICAAVKCGREPLERRMRALMDQGRVSPRHGAMKNMPREWDADAAVRLHKAGFRDFQIAKYFGVSSGTATMRITAAVVYGNGLPAPPTKQRKCLRCTHVFDSDGARVCDGCKETQAWRSGGSASLSGVRITEHG